MRACYRSAGLTPHQRGWTDAGWRHHGCNCVMDRCKCNCFCTTLREKARCILHHCIPPASLSYARGHHGLHGARVMLSVRIADLLSGRRAGSWCGTAEKNHELFPGWEGGREALFLASTVSALHRNAHIWNASHPLLVTYYCWVTVYSPGMEAKILKSVCHVRDSNPEHFGSRLTHLPLKLFEQSYPMGRTILTCQCRII